MLQRRVTTNKKVYISGKQYIIMVIRTGKVGMSDFEYRVMASVEREHWWYKTLHRMITGELKKAPNGLIVDIGCGTGGTYKYLEKRFPDMDYVGIDIALSALKFTNSCGVDKLVSASADRLPIRGGLIDVILCMDVLCYRSLDPRVCFEEFYRVLRPGGLLLMNLPAFPSLRGRHDKAVGIHRRFKKLETRIMAEEIGFENVTSSYWNMVLSPFLLVWRWMSRFSSDCKSDLTLPGQRLNNILGELQKGEYILSKIVTLPFGSSLFISAQKPVYKKEEQSRYVTLPTQELASTT